MVNPCFPDIFFKAASATQKVIYSLCNKVQQLSEEDIQSYIQYSDRHYLRGWKLSRKIDSQDIWLIVLLDSRFPQTAPDVFVDEPKGLCLKIPHIEHTNKLCLFGPQDTIISSCDGKIVEDSLRQAEALLDDGLQEKNKEDFINEFLSYWIQFCHIQHSPIPQKFSALDLDNKISRIISHIQVNNISLLAEDKERGELWISRCHPGPKPITQEGIFLWLMDPLFPDDYPKTNLDIWRLTQKVAPNLSSALLQCTPKQRQTGFPVCFAFDTLNGPALVGSWLSVPKAPTKPGTLRTLWRSGNLPQKFFCPQGPAIPFEVERADHSWIYFRGGTGHGKELEEMKIAVIGGGSLGSRVIENLCSAGIGQFSLFDADILSAGNVGRHLLGMSHVGQKKTEAICKFLLSKFPHLSIKSFLNSWEDSIVDDSSRKEILDADLLISTTGEMPSNQFLNAFLLEESNKNLIPPAIFAWAEPFCCAGHAVYVDFSEGCLQCGLKNDGQFKFRATDWPQGRDLETMAPACGVSFMPYGHLEMIPIAHMTATLAIEVLMREVEAPTHRTWLASNSILKASRGSWTTWAKANRDGNTEGLHVSNLWSKNIECQSCSR